MAPTTRVSNRNKHPGYILRLGAYSIRKTAAKKAAIKKIAQTKREIPDDDDPWEGPSRPSALSNAHSRNKLIDSKHGQKAGVENRRPHKYKHTLKKQLTPQELVGDEEDPELAQHGKRKQRVVDSANSTDDESSTSKKLKREKRIAQPASRVEVLLPRWRAIVARDAAELQLKQMSKLYESHPKEEKGLDPAQVSNIDYGDHGDHDDEDKTVEEDEDKEEESNIIGQSSSQHVPINDLRHASASLPQNSQSGNCGSSNATAGLQPKSTPLLSTQRKVMGTLPQVSKSQARISTHSTPQSAKKPYPRFRMEDLPDGTQQRFREDLGPLWLEFVSTLENPWDLTNHVDVMQELWNITFTDIDYTVQKTNDPVYSLLLQRAYRYRCDFAKRGETAVAAYLDSIGLNNPDEIARYINFLVPSVSGIRGDEEPAKCYPFMWQEATNIMNEEGHVERTETRGAFRSRPISDTLALYLEIRECIPPALRQSDRPRGALVLATVSVERALRMYSTGTYVKHKDRFESTFSRKHWGVTTDEVMISVKKTTSRGWKKIIKAAIPYIKTRKPHHGMPAALEEEREEVNGYTRCVDVDSGSDSGSDVIF